MNPTAQQKKYLRTIRKLVVATHWIKGSLARREGFTPTGNPHKVCYCLEGLIRVVTKPTPPMLSTSMYAMVPMPTPTRASRDLRALVWAKIKQLWPHTKAEGIESWNDRAVTQRKDILTVIDAILADPTQRVPRTKKGA